MRSGASVLCAPNWRRRAGRCCLASGCGEARCRSAERTLFYRPRSPRRGPSLSPPSSSASRPSPLPPQVPPSLVTGRSINPLPRRIPTPRETLVLWPLGREPTTTAAPPGLCAPAARRLSPPHLQTRLTLSSRGSLARFTPASSLRYPSHNVGKTRRGGAGGAER